MDQDLSRLGIERRVVVSQNIDISRASVQGLCEAIQAAFRDKNKPVRLQYTKGEPLVVERLVPKSMAAEDSEFLTPYEMVRQHADIEILENEGSSLEMVCRAAMALADKNYPATMLISLSRDTVDRWFGAGKVDAILRLPFLEDPDCPEGYFILCGSQTGVMMSQIEYAVLCRMEP